MRTIMTKLIGAGRATLFGVGLAVVLTLTAGGVTTALAAQPGDPFRLGQLNVLDGATTILSGTQTNGAMLEIGNSSSEFDDPALRLRVQAGRPPLEVSAGAGKATNLDADKLDGKDASEFANGINGKALDANTLDGLDSTAFASGSNGIATNADKFDGLDSTAFANGTNGKANDADKLDGKDSTAFANGTNGKANDADKLDGKDSTAFANGTNGKANDTDKLDGKDSLQFWSGKTYEVHEIEGISVGNGPLVSAEARCDAGDTVLDVGGGAHLDDLGQVLVSIRTFTNGGTVVVKDTNGALSPIAIQLICADFPPLRP